MLYLPENIFEKQLLLFKWSGPLKNRIELSQDTRVEKLPLNLKDLKEESGTSAEMNCLLPDRQTQGRQVSKWQSPSIGPRVMLFPGDDWADWMDGWMFMKRTPKKRSTLSSGGLRGLDHHNLRGNHSGLQSRGQFLIFFNYKSGGISN